MKKLLALVAALAIGICTPGVCAWGENSQGLASGDFESAWLGSVGAENADSTQAQSDFVRRHLGFITNPGSPYTNIALDGSLPTHIRQAYIGSMGWAANEVWETLLFSKSLLKVEMDGIMEEHDMYDVMIYDIVGYTMLDAYTEERVEKDALELIQTIAAEADRYSGSAKDVTDCIDALMKGTTGGRTLLENSQFLKEISEAYGKNDGRLENLGLAIKGATKVCDLLDAAHISDGEYAQIVRECYSFLMFMDEYEGAIEQLLSTIYEVAGVDMNDETARMTEKLIRLLRYVDMSEEEFLELLSEEVYRQRVSDTDRAVVEVVFGGFAAIAEKSSSFVTTVLKGYTYGVEIGDFITNNSEYSACLSMISCYGLFLEYLGKAVKETEEEFLADPTEENALKFHTIFKLYHSTEELAIEKYILPAQEALVEGNLKANTLLWVLNPMTAFLTPHFLLSAIDHQGTIEDVRDFQERWKQVDCCGDYWPFDWGGTDGSQSGEMDSASDGSKPDSPPQIDPAVVWQDDFDKDGTEEAFFLSGAFRTPDENVVYSELWYEDASGARQIDSATAYFEPDASVFDVGDRKLFIIDDYTDGSVGVMGAKVWTVKDGEPATLSISSNSKDICFIRQEQGLEFSFSHSSYDTGHTFKRYYMYWNGNGFTEYGGLRISEAQLRAVEGASRWLDEIIASGGVIGDIFYRENGIVNINYAASGGWIDDMADANNATLRIVDGVAGLVYSEEETLYGSNYRGVYEASVLDDASFPEIFPYADVSGSGDSADNDALVEYYVDLDGDGVEERLAFCYAGDKAYGDAAIALCVFRASGESIHRFETETFSQYSNYSFRAALIPDGNRQKIFLESVSFAGDVQAKSYTLLGYAQGEWTEQATVHDPGYSDSVFLGLVSAPGAMETELYYNDMAYSPFDCGQEYLSALANVFGSYGIGFELAEREIYEPYEGAYYAGGTYFRAIFPGACLWEWTHVPEGAPQPSDSFAEEIAQGGEEAPERFGENSSAQFAYTTGKVNVRKGPGLGYDSMGTIPKGAQAEYLNEFADDDRGVRWYKIRYDGREGWVSSKYAKLTGDSASAEQPVQTGTNQGTIGGQSVYATGRVYIRKGPGLGYDSVGTVQKGETATYLNEFADDARGVRWYKIRHNGKEGWVSSKYAKLTGSASQSMVSSGSYVKATSGDTYVRSGPGLAYERLSILYEGDRADYLGETARDDRGVNWYKVRHDGEIGWVSSKYTTLA